MLREPQKDWTLDDMVVAAVTSRGTRVRVFRKASGLPPMAWLSAVTGYGEAEAIGNLDLVAAIAAAAGYKSEAALSKAFLRHFGVRPGAIRQR